MKETLKDLNLEDDFLFAKVMMDKEVCRRVLEHILNIEIEKIEYCSKQNTIDILLESKGVRLDVYVKDEKGTIFNCEMQRGKKKELPKRSRYYQGSIDLDLIAKGDDYIELKPSYVIFICTFDPFNKKKCCYTFKEICLEDRTLLLGDETTKVFLNTKGKTDDVDDILKEFLGYIEDSSDSYVKHAKSDLIRFIHRRVAEVKESKEMEVEFMTLMQRDREKLQEGIEQGIEQGEKRGMKKATSIVKLLQKGYSTNAIAQELEMEEEEVKKFITEIEAE